MSGHSKWSTIKHQKAANDAARGKLFSRLSKAISVAVKVGGSPDPSANSRLRVAIDQAKAANMPKSNIQRAVKRASETGDMVEATYEGFGPGQVAMMVDVATDNKNRTTQEIKMLFDRNNGVFGGSGSVAFNFEPKGLIVVPNKKDEEYILELIDAGVEEYEENDDQLDCYVAPDVLHDVKVSLDKKGIKVIRYELTQKPLNYQKIDDESVAKKILNFLDKLENHDDVQNVHSNFDIDDDLLDKIQEE